jgi:hypothetical protein
MRYHHLASGMAALALSSGVALSQQPMSGHTMDDAHAGHVMAVGTVNFANSCAPAVQADFARGVAMLHSFWYSAGELAFRNVLSKDPDCAIAHWGIASLLMLNALNGVGSTPKGAEQAQEELELARHTGNPTKRERDYIEAVAVYYQDFAKQTESTRQQARSKAYEALAARYPEDDEAQIFSALYIAGTQSQADQTFAAYAKAAAILQKEFAKLPQHPGISHYLIHVYDAPPLVEQGLAAARLYATLAPDAPHALHMPSHIFTRVGAWEDSAATNLRAFSAAVKGNEPGEAFHATDYAVYGYLQLGRDKSAAAAMDNALALKVTPPYAGPIPYSSASMPARMALERGDWAAATKLEPAKIALPYTTAITWFARALGAARLGDVETAQRNAAELEPLHKALVDAKNTYWALEVEVQQHTAAGWIALAQHKPDEALTLMRQAADQEDSHEKHIVTPGRILPARELLGDMLLESGQPTLALQAYEASQQREPNRLRGYYGAARAAEASGDKAKATLYYAKLIDLTKNADSPRPEVTEAKAYAAK